MPDVVAPPQSVPADPTPPPPEADSGFRMSGVGKHALIYGAGMLLNRAVGFLMLPLYTRFLTPADYGVMGLIEMTLDVVSIIAGGRLAQGIFRYYYKTQDPRERRDVVATAMLGLAISYAAVAVLCFLASDFFATMIFGDASNGPLFRIASGSLFFRSLVITPLAYARVRDRSLRYVMAQLVQLFVGLSLNVVFLVWMGMGVKGIFLSSLISSAGVGLWLTAWLVRSVGFGWARQAVRDLLRYGIPIVGMEMATFVIAFADRFFLQHSADSAAVGLYDLAYRFGFLLAALASYPMEQVWAPKRFEVADRPDRDAILSRAFLYQNVVLVSLALVFALLSRDVIRIMTTPAFFSAATLIPIILVAYVFQGWAGIQDIGILIREKTEYLTLANFIAAGVAVAGYATLIPRWYGLGAAVSTVAAIGTRWGLTFVFSQRLWPVRYQWTPVLKLIGLAFFFWALGATLSPEPIVASIAVRSGFLALYGLAVWRAGVLNDDERAWLLTAGGGLLRRASTRVRPRTPATATHP